MFVGMDYQTLGLTGWISEGLENISSVCIYGNNDISQHAKNVLNEGITSKLQRVLNSYIYRSCDFNLCKFGTYCVVLTL